MNIINIHNYERMEQIPMKCQKHNFLLSSCFLRAYCFLEIYLQFQNDEPVRNLSVLIYDRIRKKIILHFYVQKGVSCSLKREKKKFSDIVINIKYYVSS